MIPLQLSIDFYKKSGKGFEREEASLSTLIL
jgi:hypothetical protein